MKKWMKNLILCCFMILGAANIGHTAEQINEKKEELTNVVEFDTKFSWFYVDVAIEEIDERVKKGFKTIDLRLNSPGGSIIAGNRLIHTILKHQMNGIKFRGIVKEYCYSMCFVTLQFLNERIAYPFAFLLDHSASGGAQLALREISELLNNQIYARLKAAGKTPGEIELYKRLVYNEFFMNTKTALGLGIIDRIVLPGQENKKVAKDVKVQPKPAVK